MVQYDPKVIAEFANRLYAQANRMLFSYSVLGFLLGGLTGGGFLAVAAGSSDMQVVLALLGFVMLGGFFALCGFLLARERSFVLRLQAQTALCQYQIEMNTRAFSVGHHAAAAAAAASNAAIAGQQHYPRAQ